MSIHLENTGMKAKLLLAMISLFIALTAGEFFLQRWFHFKKNLYVPPTRKNIFNIRTDNSGNPWTQTIYSQFGRDPGGGEFTPENTYRILAIGGSTTECFYPDQIEAWPYQVQTNLRKENFRDWVANAGFTGYSTKKHLKDIDLWWKQYPSVKTRVFLVGINDFSKWICRPMPAVPLQKQPFYKKTGHWRLWSKAKELTSARPQSPTKKNENVML